MKNNIRSYAKLKRIPTGFIKAEGFLKDQMLRGKDGMAGHLRELEPQMIGNPFVTGEVHVDAWGGENPGWCSEISGNYWAGYIQHAFILGDPEMIRIATDWVNAAIARQEEDGYLGLYRKGKDDMLDDYNGGTVNCYLRAILAFYEITGRGDVLEAARRCLLWFKENWAGDNKTCYAGPSLIQVLCDCYLLTGDERLKEFAIEYDEWFCEHDIFKYSRKSLKQERLLYNHAHTVLVSKSIKLPTMMYSVTGNKEYLDVAENYLAKLKVKGINHAGSPVSFNEFLGPVSSTAETEYCCYAHFNMTYSELALATGKAKYGDYMEELFYNGAQGARKKDEHAIAYLNSANQIYAHRHSSTAQHDMQVYAACYPTACCPVNSVRLVPEFVRAMMLTDDNGNIYTNIYGPCSMNYDGISIFEKTMYPFRNNVSFEINAEREFSLFLKVPEWALGYTVTIDGKVISLKADERGYMMINIPTGSSEVSVNFEAKPQIIHLDDSDTCKKYPIAFKYGALLFCYHIPEVWKSSKVRAGLKQPPEEWGWFSAAPYYEEADVRDVHEQIGLRRYQYSWNVAVDENITPDELEVELIESNEYVWSCAPIRLHTTCYKAPYLCSPYPMRTFEPFEDRQLVTDKLELVLEPYGCSNLRITYFPRADLDKS